MSTVVSANAKSVRPIVRVKSSVGKTTLARVGHTDNRWFVVDAADQTLGRLASAIATRLMGKHKPTYTPTVDVGDFIVVINTSKIKVTGRKLAQREYDYYTYYTSGRRVKTMLEMTQKHPNTLFCMAVRRMLPKTTMGVQMLRKLKCYKDADHPHAAQRPETITLQQ